MNPSSYENFLPREESIFPARLTGVRLVGGKHVYHWREQTIDASAAGGYADLSPGRFGDPDTAPLYEMNNADVDVADRPVVRVRLRGMEGGRLTYEFQAPAGAAAPLPRVLYAQVTEATPLAEAPGSFPAGDYPAEIPGAEPGSALYPARVGRFDDGVFEPGGREPSRWRDGSSMVYAGYDYYQSETHDPGDTPARIALLCGPGKPRVGSWHLCQYQDTLPNGVAVYAASGEPTLTLVGTGGSLIFNNVHHVIFAEPDFALSSTTGGEYVAVGTIGYTGGVSYRAPNGSNGMLDVRNGLIKNSTSGGNGGVSAFTGDVVLPDGRTLRFTLGALNTVINP